MGGDAVQPPWVNLDTLGRGRWVEGSHGLAFAAATTALNGISIPGSRARPADFGANADCLRAAPMPFAAAAGARTALWATLQVDSRAIDTLLVSLFVRESGHCRHARCVGCQQKADISSPRGVASAN